MKAVIQRVAKAKVTVDGNLISEIGPGILTLLAVETGDTNEKAQALIEKIVHLRIFENTDGKMSDSLIDKKFEHMIVSQFTLAADTSKGRRPSFSRAESPERARSVYELAITTSQAFGIKTVGGQFQAHMQIDSTNDGPVTFIIE